MLDSLDRETEQWQIQQLISSPSRSIMIIETPATAVTMDGIGEEAAEEELERRTVRNNSSNKEVSRDRDSKLLAQIQVSIHRRPAVATVIRLANPRPPTESGILFI